MEGCIKFNQGTKPLLLSPGPSFPEKVLLQQGIPAASLGTPPAGHMSQPPHSPSQSRSCSSHQCQPPGSSSGSAGTGGGMGRRCSRISTWGASLPLLLPLDAKSGSVGGPYNVLQSSLMCARYTHIHTRRNVCTYVYISMEA